MKRIVLTFGLISGGILAAMMWATLPFMEQIGFDNGQLVGYTTMVLAFLLIFFGIRSYRDTIGNGYITFGRGFKVGILITLIACLCYTVAWEILYYNFMPDFGDKYTQYLIEKSRASGVSPEQIAKEVARVEQFKEIFKNPIYNFLLTFFIEPLPVGLVMTVLSALILKKRREGVPQNTELVSNP
jgi:Protein of unknown function (DUF4199)